MKRTPAQYRLENYEGETIATGTKLQMARSLEHLYPVELRVEPNGDVTLDGELIAKIVRDD